MKILLIFLLLSVGWGFLRNSPLGQIRHREVPQISQQILRSYNEVHFNQHEICRVFVKECRKLSVGLVTIAFAFGISYPSIAKDFPIFEEAWTNVQQNFFDNTYNNNNWDELKKDYEKRLESGADEIAITKDMLGKLGDKYSRFLDKDQYQALFKYDAIGVGIIFKSSPNEGLSVAAPPIAGSSGEKNGLREGDIITKINDKDATKMTAIQTLEMLSTDESKTVSIEFCHPGESTKQKVVLERSYEKASNPVSFKDQILASGNHVGYIRLKEFNADAVRGVEEALDKLNTKNIDNLILDLRGNTGGGFEFAINIGGMFMDDKMMVIATGKGLNDKTSFRTSYPKGVLFRKPVTVVTDGLTASASEVLVSGLRDNCRATVVGSRSFGKGKIQGVFGLSEGTGMTLTVAQYLSPKGNIIQGNGIEPDFPLPSLNPYVGLLLRDTPISNIDFNTIDLNKANSILQSCTPFKES
jgi:carboxyl-terminal processing protease